MAGEVTWDSLWQLQWRPRLTHSVVIRSGNNLPGPSTITCVGMHTVMLCVPHTGGCGPLGVCPQTQRCLKLRRDMAGRPTSWPSHSVGWGSRRGPQPGLGSEKCTHTRCFPRADMNTGTAEPSCLGCWMGVGSKLLYHQGCLNERRNG